MVIIRQIPDRDLITAREFKNADVYLVYDNFLIIGALAIILVCIIE